LLKHDGKGGATLLVDGWYCAEKLKEKYPEDFDVLTKIDVKSIFREENKYFMFHVDPVIKLNSVDGSYKQIR
jgi:trimethyllysine dioxygenase